MPDNRFTHILDTSSIIAYLADEPGAGLVARFRRKSAIPFIAMSELYYVVARKLNTREADQMYGIVKGWGLPLLFPAESVMINAGRFKAAFKLGIADSYMAAFTKEHNATLLTSDSDYTIVKDMIRIQFIR